MTRGNTYSTSRVYLPKWVAIPWFLIFGMGGGLVFCTLLTDYERSLIELSLIGIVLAFAISLTFSNHRVLLREQAVLLNNSPLFHKKINYSSIEEVSKGKHVNTLKEFGFGPKLTSQGWFIGNTSGPTLTIKTFTGKEFSVVVPDEAELDKLTSIIKGASRYDFFGDIRGTE